MKTLLRTAYYIVARLSEDENNFCYPALMRFGTTLLLHPSDESVRTHRLNWFAQAKTEVL